jgi:uncharacterized protein (TIGR01370 family)
MNLRTLCWRTALGLCVGAMAANGSPALSSASATGVAFYYGKNLPPELAIYDAVVVHPENLPYEEAVRHVPSDRLIAYTTVGEIDPTSGYAQRVPRELLVGANSSWQSLVVDLSSPRWEDFFVTEILAPLWRQGYRGFFLDTLDSYQLIAATPALRAAQEQGLVRLIRRIKATYPEARLIFNRGFEILPQVPDAAYAVVAESLFQGWDNATGRFTEVSRKDREWLLERLNTISKKYDLPVVVIDYADGKDRATMRDLARRIRQEGFMPWVTTPHLDALGVGIHDIVPRRVLILYDPRETPRLMNAEAHRLLAMPLNYLGLIPEYRDAGGALPTTPLAGRYAGVVVWLAAGNNIHGNGLLPWLKAQTEAALPLALINHSGVPLDRLAPLGIAASGIARADIPYRIAERSVHAGFEIEPPLTTGAQPHIKAPPGAQVWLRLRQGETVIEPVAITDWGGYAMWPHAVAELPQELGLRWVIDPFEFLLRALQIELMPTPDVTTENGHRLLTVHVDGDGFANRAEFPGSPFASRVLLDDVLKRYRLPTTVSVIQGEVAADGLYPELSPQLEPIARAMFVLPHVEIATHTYSHPFDWPGLEADDDAEGLNLPIPGYAFRPEVEIDGSVRYINEHLAPPGKATRVVLWSGDCDPGSDAVGRAYALGLGNMNGGETIMTATQPTLTEVAPLGIPKGDHFQVYAPNQNENVYTNLWSGPFYGYERVIETFELTGAPRRLKPVGIYYHTYSASKPAALDALHKVYRWALDQDLLPIHASEYIRKAQEFNRIVLTREGGGWGIFNAVHLKTVRLPSALGYPDLRHGSEIVGFSGAKDVRYVHLSGAPYAALSLQTEFPGKPYLVRATGQVSDWRRRADGGFSMKVDPHTAGKLEVHVPSVCRLRAEGATAVDRDAESGTVAFSAGGDAVQLVVDCSPDGEIAGVHP